MIGFKIIKSKLCLIITGIVLITNSCSRDKEIEPSNSNLECVSIPPFSQIGSGYNYITNGSLNYYAPVLNPNNNNELLILKNDSIFIYNRISHNKIFSIKFSFWGKISWSKKNWLLILGSNQHIYKVKPNGDSLTLLVNTTSNLFPIWNDDGSKFSSTNNILNKSIVYDYNGLPLDTISMTNQLISEWGNNDKIICGGYTLFVFDIATKTLTSFYNLSPGNGVITGSFWLNNSEIIWSYDYGIYKTNIITNSTILLKQLCNSNKYSYPTYDKILNKIIWRKQEEFLIDNYNVRVINKIVMMDIDCKNEVDIEIH